jgi:phenylalanyl-tRNA synthetase beta chain
MKISFSWLREHLRTEKSAAEIAEILTHAGLEVGSIESTGVAINQVVAAQILSSEQHPNADRLSVCRVDDGSGMPRQIVCGAKNYKVGDKVPLALPGAVMPGDFKIKVGKLRGVASEGMMCSAKELGLGEGADGLLILDPETLIGTPLGELFPAEEILEIEITPNRPDWLSHHGVAREAAAFGAGELIENLMPLPSMQEDRSMDERVHPEIASLYSIRRMEGVQVGPSPAWLRERIESVGLRSINNIVDVTNFVMFETGQPLHAFDAAKIEGALRVRFATEGEKFTALDGTVYQLTANDPVIADAQGVQALAGIMGGKASAVSENTTSLLLESARFEPVLIRRSSRSLGISTDSSYRFERSMDAANALAASARATSLILTLSGGAASAELLVAGSLPPLRSIVLRGERVRSLLGIDLDDAAMTTLLAQLGIQEVASGFEIPSWRSADLLREVDLIEEVARLYGIEKMTARLQGIPAHFSRADRTYDFALGLRRLLAGMGCHEARSGTLTGSRDQQSYTLAPVIRVRNPMGEEHSTLRASLIPGLLNSVARNIRQGAEMIRLFEIGRVYQSVSPEERTRLGLVCTGRAAPADWRGALDRRVDLFDLKGILAHLGPLSFSPTTHEHLPLALDIVMEGKPIGILGILSPAASREVSVGGHQGHILVAELDVMPLQKILTTENFQEISLPKYPSIRRDLALLLDSATSYVSVEEAVQSAKEPLFVDMMPFDIFSDATGEKIPLKKKSLAIALTFQHSERTLATEEVTEALGRIVTRLREMVGAEIRS